MAQKTTDEQVPAVMSAVRRRYIVLSGKGGVGKSTVAVAIAARLSTTGSSVGLLDVDLHGPSVPTLLGLRGRRASGTDKAIEPVWLEDGRLKVMSVQFMLDDPDGSVIWRGPLKHNVIAQLAGSTVWGDIEYLIIDSPPGTGDEPLSAVRTAAPHGAIVVTTPQDVSTLDVRKSIDFCRKVGLPVVGVIENMSGFVCPHCGTLSTIFGSGGGRRMAEDMGVPFLCELPIDPLVVSDGDEGRWAAVAREDSGWHEALGLVVNHLREWSS